MSKDEIRVDFYLLPGDSLVALHQFCCRLTEKAWRLGNRVWLRTASDADSKRLDDLLWHFSDTSFVPHLCTGDADAADTPVVIGQHHPAANYDLLINLGHDIPSRSGCKRIAEVLNDDPAI